MSVRGSSGMNTCRKSEDVLAIFRSIKLVSIFRVERNLHQRISCLQTQMDIHIVFIVFMTLLIVFSAGLFLIVIVGLGLNFIGMVFYLLQTHEQYYRNAYEFWQNQGLNGPEGTMRGDVYDSATVVRQAKKSLELGKICCAFDGPRPILVVSDTDVMHQLCIKDFNTFPNRSNRERAFSLESEFLHNMYDDQWRRVRPVWSSAFTSAKVRRMYKLIESCTDDMIEALGKQLRSKPLVDLRHLFNLYTMDSVATCFYSLRLSRKGKLTKISKLDEFIQMALDMFDSKLWQKFASIVQQLIKSRRKSGKQFSDFLQTLIDAENSENETTKTEPRPGKNGSDVRQKSETQNFKESLLSENEILASAMLLFRFGFESTSTLLTHCVYTLSFHQEIQEKLYQTIRTTAKYDTKDGVTFDYDSLITCEYLDAVIAETLRKHPPVLVTLRCASEDYYLESHKLRLPKGTGVLFSLEAIMNDPDNWSKPEVFDPERFMPENRHKIKPNSYCPIGVGPRSCLGMRFSLTGSKFVLAKLLLEYRFEPAPETKYPAENDITYGLNNLKRPEVMAIKR